MFFARALTELDLRVAAPSDAARFALEVPDKRYDFSNPMGLHSIYKYLDMEKMARYLASIEALYREQ